MLIVIFYFLCLKERNDMDVFCFFQAEDGIRDIGVTGVQTCALPIFGIKLALGAHPSTMAQSVVAQGMRHAAAGVALGLPVAFLLSRVMASMLFGITTHDPLTFAGLPILVTAATTLACYLPARRAARIDPIAAIRQE